MSWSCRNLFMAENIPGGLTCSARPAEQIARGVVVMLVGTFAVALGYSAAPAVAVAAVSVSVGMGFIAVTGWCPGASAQHPTDRVHKVSTR